MTASPAVPRARTHADRRRAPRVRLVALAPAVLALAGCVQPARLVDPAPVAPPATPIAAPDPSQPGPWRVGRLFYGSGTDRRRPEYRDSVTLRTATVNGTPFLRGGDDGALRRRWRWWGFDATRLPVNGRVWYPEGPGPWPVVLVVHGNHGMKEFSDPGYGYLGESLASRGFIVASVDENFLNQGIRGENDARAWLLLEHLRAWRRFAHDSDSPLRGRVDLSRIALIGHSRGGEAVAVAAAFNRLTRYPDDARVLFDYGFAIRSVVAIAPVDGQYRPADRPTPLADVSYLTLHGSHDGDVSTFLGQRQYQRVQLTSPDHRKAAIYIYRANHGQFNTVWGTGDVIGPYGWFLRTGSLLSGEAQRRAGLVFINGWLELTVHDDRRYEPLFEQARAAGPWVPRTIYLSRYERGGTRTLADFEEDVDVTTGSDPRVTARGVGLAAWRERDVRSRGGGSYANQAVLLGWAPPADSTAEPARYELQLAPGAAPRLGVGPGATLTFEVLAARDRPTPLPVRDTASVPVTDADRGGSARRTAAARPARGKPDTAAILDFRVEFETTDGRRTGVALSELAPLPMPLTVSITRLRRVERALYGEAGPDAVLSRYAIPIDGMTARLPGVAPADIRVIRFVFDRTAAGSILLDNVRIVPGSPTP